MTNAILGALESRPAHCERHGDYTSVLMHLDQPRWTACPACSAQAVAEREQQRIESQPADLRQMRGTALYRESGVPPRLARESLASYRVEHDGQAEAARLVSDYCDGLSGHLQTGDGLILMGAKGCGKTHLATSIVRHATRELGVSARYTTAQRFFARIQSSYGSSGESEADIIAEYANAPLLVLDEVGMSRGTDNELGLTYALLGQRHDECRPTVIATNCDADSLRGFLGDRIVDRLRETSTVVLFNWDSYRGRT